LGFESLLPSRAETHKITWNGMYQQSDKPLDIKVPLLYSAK